MVRRRLCDALGGEPDPLAAHPLVQGVKQNGHFPPAAARAAGQSNVRCGELMGQGRKLLPGIDALGCLRSLRARSALDGVSWVQGG